MMNLKARGFTLIELVVVITILGILAAFAIPKFISLDQQARIATVNGLVGTAKSAAALARSLGQALGNPPTVSMEGSTVAMLNNYPDSGATGIPNAVNVVAADFTYVGTAGTSGVWTRVGSPTPASCIVTYTPATAAGVPPTVVPTTGGC